MCFPRCFKRLTLLLPGKRRPRAGPTAAPHVGHGRTIPLRLGRCAEEKTGPLNLQDLTVSGDLNKSLDFASYLAQAFSRITEDTELHKLVPSDIFEDGCLFIEDQLGRPLASIAPCWWCPVRLQLGSATTSAAPPNWRRAAGLRWGWATRPMGSTPSLACQTQPPLRLRCFLLNPELETNMSTQSKQEGALSARARPPGPTVGETPPLFMEPAGSQPGQEVPEKLPQKREALLPYSGTCRPTSWAGSGQNPGPRTMGGPGALNSPTRAWTNRGDLTPQK